VGIVVTPRHLLVLVQTLLGQVKDVLTDNDWHGNGDPVLGRCGSGALAGAHCLQRGFAVVRGRRMCAAAVRGTGIGWRAQDPAYRGDIPAQAAARGRNLTVAQRLSHPVERGWDLGIGIPGKDLLDDLGLDRVQAYPTGIPRSFRVEHIAVGR